MGDWQGVEEVSKLGLASEGLLGVVDFGLWLLLLRVVCLVKSNILFQNMTAYKPDPAKLQGFLHTFLKHTPISRCFVKPQHCMRPVRNPFTKNKLFHCIYREKNAGSEKQLPTSIK